MRLLAAAKVNFYLEVLARRADGHHDLRTLFQTLAWGDDVEVELDEPAHEPAFASRWEGLARDVGEADDLALRAARAWVEATGESVGVRVALEKRIPLGGGLGGGSSDAAAVLRALQAARPRAALAPSALAALARGLGADVPFFLQGGSACGTGRGDVIRPLPIAPAVVLVLLLPPFGTSTARVFAHVRERGRHAPPLGLERAVEALASGVPARLRATHHNDLAEPASRAYPEFARFARAAEVALGRPPCLSGSGSTLFDVPDAGETEAVLERLAGLPGRRVVVRTTSAADPGT